MKQRKLVLGVDPGFASCGFAVLSLGDSEADDQVVTLGVLRTKPSSNKQRVLATEDNVRRARDLATSMRALHDCGSMIPVTHRGVAALFEGGDRIRLVCAERMSFPRSASAAAKVAMVWGLIVANLERRGVPLLQASPQDVKKRVAGNPAATKEAVELAMLKRFGRGLHRMLKAVPKGEHEHAFDALASIVACLDSEEGRMARMLG